MIIIIISLSYMSPPELDLKLQRELKVWNIFEYTVASILKRYNSVQNYRFFTEKVGFKLAFEK